MSSNKFRFSLFALLSIALAVSGCSGGKGAISTDSGSAKQNVGESSVKKIVNIGLKADPPSLDPMKSGALVDVQVHNSIYNKLFDLDKDLKIIPVLVESYEVSPDGKLYTFKLKKGVKFHDGTDFNAEAVKFNIERYKNPSSNRRNEVQFIENVEVVDPYTVKFYLSQTFAPMISILADRSGMMVSPEAVKKYGDDYINHPVGTGPYVFVERIKGDHITLKRNENYWNGKVNLDELNYKVFTNALSAVQSLKSGQLDFVDDVPINEIAALEKESNITMLVKPSLGFQYITINAQQEPFDNKFLRQAVNKAIDRELFIKGMFNSKYATPANSPFAPGTLAYGDSDKASKPNLEEIKALLVKGGKPNGFTFKLQINTMPIMEQFGTIVQNMLKPYGIVVELEKIDFGTILNNGATGKFQSMQRSWNGRYDPDQSFYDFVIKGQPFNFGHLSNPDLDKLAFEARVATTPEKRKELYGKAMEIVQDESVNIYIFHDFDKFAISKKITGFDYVPDGIIRTYKLDKQ